MTLQASPRWELEPPLTPRPPVQQGHGGALQDRRATLLPDGAAPGTGPSPGYSRVMSWGPMGTFVVVLLFNVIY